MKRMFLKTRLIRSKNFLIKTEQFLPAWKALKGKNTWTNWDGTQYPKHIFEIFNINGINTDVDQETGDIIKLSFNDDRNNYHLDEFFHQLAPFVTSGTLIFLSEYNNKTTYRFRDGLCKSEVINIMEDEEE